MGLFIQQNAQEGLIARQLRQHRGALETSLRRISSGLRVTTGADDPGRIGSITRLNAQIRGVQQGRRNLSDGASLMETVDGGLAEAENLLQRLRELSLIAISEHLTPLERRALQGEADQLVDQLGILAQQTRYQGQQIFGGEATKLHIQGDAGRSAPLQLKLADLRPTSLGRQARYEGERRGIFLSPLQNGELQINGVSIRGTSAADDQLSTVHHAGSALAKAAAINDATHFTGVRAIVGDTEVVGLERIQGVDLSGSRFLKINDQVISGFKVHGGDAGGHLITEINRVSGASGVIASLDAEGRIALKAPDGRNIHVEYSDLAVRNALRFIDAFGDELNLIDTVSLSSPDRALHGKVEPGVVQVLEVGSGYRGTVTASGAYRLPRDHIDYVIQVVEGGPLGTARFRFKAETTSENVAAEDFAFLAGNIDGIAVVDPPGAGRYLALGGTLVGGGSYDEGLDRIFTFEVTKAGTTDGDLLERAQFRVTSDIDGLVGEDLLASKDLTHTLTEGVTATFGQTGRSFVVSNEIQATGHNYSGGPVLFGNHTGDFDQNFVLAVSQGGYTDGSAELQLSRDGGATFEAPFPLLPWDPIALNGELSVRFPDRNGRVSAAVAHRVTGSFNGTATSGGTYTGTESIRYGIRVTTAGALGGSARGVITENGVATGGDFALVDGAEVSLGGGATLRLDAGSPSLSATTASTSDGYDERVEIRGPYLGEDNGEVVARVRQAGRVDGSARLEYSLDGGVTFQGDLAVRSGGAIALDDGLSISFDPAPAPVVDPPVIESVTYAGAARLGGVYTDEEDADL
ncbi:MAG: hypothetical protein VYD19_10565, partial [Myxococcota bacterium]|nr:hypothetical protein [Myxococcota bacterium]